MWYHPFAIGIGTDIVFGVSVPESPAGSTEIPNFIRYSQLCVLPFYLKSFVYCSWVTFGRTWNALFSICYALFPVTWHFVAAVTVSILFCIELPIKFWASDAHLKRYTAILCFLSQATFRLFPQLSLSGPWGSSLPRMRRVSNENSITIQLADLKAPATVVHFWINKD